MRRLKTLEEAKSLGQLMINRDQVFAVAHTYTGYPMVRQLRRMIEAGAIGQIQKIDAQYYQGWINEVLHDEETRQSTWRLQPTVAGASCCFGDIGVHAFNLVEYTTGLRISQVLADTDNLHPDNELDVDGTALFKTKCGVRGLIRASQIASGEENNLAIAVYGRQGEAPEAFSNKSRTPASLCPMYLFSSSGPLTEITLSPQMAAAHLTKNVFPDPGGP